MRRKNNKAQPGCQQSVDQRNVGSIRKGWVKAYSGIAKGVALADSVLPPDGRPAISDVEFAGKLG